MHIHLTIVQPERYVHSLGFLDTADYLQHWLEARGVMVTLAKNRLRHDAVNIVFGAHLGMQPEWLEPRYCAFFFNLEQIGQGGASISPAYQALLRSGPVIDYHPLNVASYRSSATSVPLVPFLNAPYLNPTEAVIDWKERPIDLLFFGSVNAERKAFLKRVEQAGWDVAVFDSPTYYAERDAYVRQAKAVINTSFYASARFEQVRAFNVLSQGTAFISYLQPGQQVAEEFRDHVFWVDDASFDRFFREEFGSPHWALQAQEKYGRWLQTDPSDAMGQLLDVIDLRWRQCQASSAAAPARPRVAVQADDGSYFQDAVNLSPRSLDQADLTLDLLTRQSWPWAGTSHWGQSLVLDRAQLERMAVRESPPSATQWSALCANAMDLLCEGGQLMVDVAVDDMDRSQAERPRPRSAGRVLDDFSDSFWRSGAFEHKVVWVSAQYLDAQRQPASPEAASYCRLTCEKQQTTARERTLARVASPDFARRRGLP